MKQIHTLMRFLPGALLGLLVAHTQAAQIPGGYKEKDLVSNQTNVASFVDTNLVNAWGFLFTDGKLVVVDNGSGMATAYNPAGHPMRLQIKIPAPGGGPGAPTDVVQNPSDNSFYIASTNRSRPSTYLFATEDGTIAGWNSRVDSTNAIIAVDNSAAGAIYKGAAVAQTTQGPRLYVADFGRGTVEIYDRKFLLLKSFTDPDLAATNYVPFGIQNFGARLFVTFALKADPKDRDETAGPGLGFVDQFDLDGNLVRRFASQGTLNAPWGMTMAPRNFGKFSQALLVGNFGDGAINVYDPQSGAFLGQLTDRNGAVLQIEGLWGLGIGPGKGGNPFLYFTAGPDDESNGLLGTLSRIPQPGR